MRCCCRRHRRIRNVPGAMDGRRSNARGGFVFRVSIEDEKVEILSRYLPRKRVRTNQTVAIAAERKMHRLIRLRIGCCFEFPDVACYNGIEGDFEPRRGKDIMTDRFKPQLEVAFRSAKENLFCSCKLVVTKFNKM